MHIIKVYAPRFNAITNQWQVYFLTSWSLHDNTRFLEVDTFDSDVEAEFHAHMLRASMSVD